jgi:hypothetical protein
MIGGVAVCGPIGDAAEAMSDTTPTRRRHDADTTTARDVVSPTEAAARLGITPDAVRARLRRGTLAGERVDGDWRVFLPSDATPIESRHDDRHDTDTTPSAMLLAAKDETITRLDAEVAFLRDQLDHSRRELATERERFDVLHREALGRIPQLTAGETVRPSDTGPPDSARPGANGEATGGAETHRESVVVSVWRRLFGRG